jgi:ATP-binding cassette subfamily B protein
VVASGFQLALPLVLRDAVDALRTPSSAHLLGRYVTVFAALAVGQAAFKFVSRNGFMGAARRVEHDLRTRYFTRLIRLPAERIEAGRKGDFVSRATHDLQDVRLFLGAGALNFLQTLVLLLSATVLLWRIHPLLTLTALAPFPVVSVLVRRYSPRLHRRYLEANRKAGELSALVQESLAGARVARVFHREGWQEERFRAANGEVREAQARVIRAWALLFPLVGAVAGLGHVAVLGLGGFWVSTGELTLGDFVAFNAYLGMLTWPMVALGWTMSLAQRGAAALERLGEVLEAPPAPDGDLPVPSPRGTALEAEGLRFAYGGGAEGILTGVDLAVPGGTFRGLVGATGSGKSTLISLLARLREPLEGRILVHGVPLDRVRDRELRDFLALVPQEDFFFADTVENNVLLGRAPDQNLLRWSLEVAGLAEDVAGMTDGVASVVGEGGVTLSGGQRQRLAIARALYGRPKCLLMDSALSSLDAATARRVLEGVRAAIPGLTLLVVSHRGSEVESADRVCFLEGGRIAAEGTHAELLREVPAYLRLYREERLRQELMEAAG